MGDSHPGSRPNVLLATVDSLRADRVGCYGHDRDTTPTIDLLAERGVRFTDAFAHACSTRPSFPSVLTSVYPTMYGGYERVSAEQTVVSEAFSAAGYRTAGFHSNLYLGAEFGYGRGFDAFFDSKAEGSAGGSAGETTGLAQAIADRLPSDGPAYRTLARLHDAALDRFGGGLDSAYVTADDLTDRAIDWVEDSGGSASGIADAPRFLWVHYMDAHHPYLPPAHHQRELGNEAVPDRRAMALRRKMLDDPDAVTDGELGTLRDLYDAEIRFVDAELDRLVSAAREAWGDVTVAVTADHGEEFREHGGFSHRATFHDELLRVPLVVAEVGAANDDPSTRSTFAGTHDELVGLIDLAPTLLAHAGIDSPDSYCGLDLADLVGDGEGGSWNRDAVLGDWVDLDTGEQRFAYRDREWKLVRRESGNELYHLSTDPGETTNLADSEPAVVERLGGALDDHERAIEATRVDVGAVEMDESVRRRLRELGYQE